MEILGLVWAASIINQPSPIVVAAGTEASMLQQQHHILIEGVEESLIAESLFTPLAQAVSWPTIGVSLDLIQIPGLCLGKNTSFQIGCGLEPTTAFSHYAFTASSIVPNFNSVVKLPSGNFESLDAQFTPLSPSISTGLTDFSPPIKTSPDVSDWEGSNTLAHWHSWDAIAAVRTVETAQSFHLEAPSSEFGSQCLADIPATYQTSPIAMLAAPKLQVWVHNHFMGEVSFNAPLLDSVQVQMAMEGLTETSQSFYGIASWYGPGFHGRKTANGERFDENSLTAAHKTLPFNTRLKVTNRLNGKSVVVRINDRGPYFGKRSLDLSKAAAQCLGSIRKGIVPYEATVLEPLPHPGPDGLTTAKAPVE